MAKRVGPNTENLEQTRRLFLDLAEKEFNQYGYTKASTTRIVEASGMARGSLYYHFKDKQDMFRAVYIDIMEKTSSLLATRLGSISDPWDAFVKACEEYFNICTSPDKSRIFLIESQTALPYEELHQVIARTIRPVLTDSLSRLAARGDFDGRNKEMLAIFIFGALGESGRILNVVSNRELAMEQFFETFIWAMKKLA
jgi:AcrR family transcriptional regulator